MKSEFDCDLAPDLWETLKILRTPRTVSRPLNRHTVEKLISLGLASTDSGIPAITPRGRYVLIRGSLQLLDVAA